MGTSTTRRRLLVIMLGVCLLVLFLSLATLNAFKLSFLTPNSPIQALVFISLSIIAFLLFVAVLVALVRNFMKLYGDQRSHVLGTRLRTRMLWGAILVSLAPLVFMFAFSYLLMNRAVDRWFSQPVNQIRADANTLATELFRYAAANARSEADSLAVEISSTKETKPANINAALLRHDLTLQGGFAIVYSGSNVVASLHMPTGALRHSDASTPEDNMESSLGAQRLEAPQRDIPQAILHAAQRNDAPFYSFGEGDFTLATAALQHGGTIVVGLPIPRGISATSLRLSAAADAYWTLFRERREVRNLYSGLLLLTTTLALFACCWLALNFSKQVTRPIETLSDAMEAIATGDYAHRVPDTSTEELGELAASFNAMAADLESARVLANRSTAQLSQLNTALIARRRELETIIETIPNGLATFSSDRRLALANRAFYELLDPGGQRSFLGHSLEQIFSPDTTEVLDRLLQRSHRMGSASVEMEIPSTSGTRQISATVALLEDGPQHDAVGYVLVLEDATELLRAQKQSAWKEVARRVAHEIKNPLTPIALNAELIRRHIDRLEPVLAEAHIDSRSPAVIQRSTEVINSSVETMRSLVDQFSALAEFPSARPRPADINTIVENSLALFAGRLGNIRVTRQLASSLPLVYADPTALQRALTNLIDNAAEAMQQALLREMLISTRLLPSGFVELCVADTGTGLTDEMRERLFLPYFSTKQRGTGLGLSIAAKIIQEHQGTIRAEKNMPTGARFIMELRPASENTDAERPSTKSDLAS